MGLFNFIKGQAIDVIAWEEDSRDIIVWKFPRQGNEIKMGAQLTVRESQNAIFVNEGKLADVFQPGRHELSTRNMPFMTTLMSWKHAFNSPFKADVYFVNMRQFSNMKWGTPQPIPVSDPEFMSVPLRAFGSFNFRVKDPATFMREFAGTDREVTTEELMEHFRGMIVADFANALRKSGQSLKDIFFHSNALGEQLMPLLQPDFEQLGLELTDFSVQSVTLPDEIQAQLTEMDMEARKTRKVGTAQNEVEMQRMMQENMAELQRLKAQAEMSQNVEDMEKYMKFMQGLSMEKMAGKEGGGGNMMNNMMEMGLGLNMANMMGNMNNPNNQNTNTPKAESKDEVMKMLKELGELKEAGVLTQEEFDAKKKDLLSKL